jgi:hypothetical protein
VVVLWILLSLTILAIASRLFATYQGKVAAASVAPLLALWTCLVFVEGLALLQLARGRRHGRSLAAGLFILLGVHGVWRAWVAATGGGGAQDVGRAIGAATMAGVMFMLAFDVRRDESDDSPGANQRAAEQSVEADERS